MGQKGNNEDPEQGTYLAVAWVSEPPPGEPISLDEFEIDDETARQMRANLLAMSGGVEERYVEENPDAPWWEGATEMTTAIVLGARPEDVARVLGFDLASLEPAMLLDAPWEEDEMPLAILEVPGAVVVAEPNGFQCSFEESVRSLSRLGRTVSLYWNVNRVSRFFVAEGGTILRQFEPGIDSGEGDGAQLPEEAGVDWDEDPIGQAAALQARSEERRVG